MAIAGNDIAISSNGTATNNLSFNPIITALTGWGTSTPNVTAPNTVTPTVTSDPYTGNDTFGLASASRSPLTTSTAGMSAAQLAALGYSTGTGTGTGVSLQTNSQTMMWLMLIGGFGLVMLMGPAGGGGGRR